MVTQLGLGDFLRSRRAALAPDAVGVASHGRRRVAGLRREELAELAGVSLTYYTRLEQGHATNASDAVLDALARALRLDTAEHAHLVALARSTATPPAPDPYRVRGSTLQLIDAMTDVPTVVLARNQDVLAWNRIGHALVAPHLDASAPAGPTPPNWTRMLFCDPVVRGLYRDWAQEAMRGVASLRYVAGQFADDPRVDATIRALRVDSDEFDALWRRQPVELCTSGTKRLRHPRLGELDVDYVVLHLPEATGQRLLTHHARPGSPDSDALRVLATVTVS